MARCFVIQPFDRGKFDKRFVDTFKPAIEAAGLEAYRVDNDPSVRVPIDTIEKEIRDSAICLAEISLNNPNVWYELGYAFAAKRDVVMVCAKSDREQFPFDIQHRRILVYNTESLSDFKALQSDITERLTALMTRDDALASAPVAPTSGLIQVEVVVLITIATEVVSPEDEPVSQMQVKRDVEKAGFTPQAAAFALKSLTRKKLVIASAEVDEQWGQRYTGYRLTVAGDDWLLANSAMIPMIRLDTRQGEGTLADTGASAGDDEIPF
jgi:hypothetical protein